MKAVAERAKIDNSNLAKWMKGKPTLSEENVMSLLKAMGLRSDLTPDPECVNSFYVKKTFLVNILKSLDIYFPNGATIMRSPWVKQGISLTDTFGIGPAPQTLYALYDGQTRAILRLPRSLILYPEKLSKKFTWKTEPIYIDGPNNFQIWETKVPSIDQFDSAFNYSGKRFTAKDVLNAIQCANMSYEEAIKRLKQKV
ncbi:MAG: hypothetical protein COB46_07715 [Rhodospirillaceae bacterium]|nr:MAG: hypothetical protein COB46_07715 [Rhodospirillaceae bacterium]